MKHATTRQQAYERLADQDRAFLRAVADAFGKPDAITIRFADGGRYDGGRFLSAQDYPDFRQRADVLHQKFVRGES